jgi:uncharacterized peroxidase-related enzyme
MPFFPSFPPDANVASIVSRRPDFYAPWIDMVETLMRGPSPLSVPQRELIAAWVSRVNQCAYCHGGHAAAATILGYPADVFDRLTADIATAPVEPNLRPILAYVKKVGEAPYRIVQADADAVFAAGWDERALHDAIAIACVFSFMNRLTLAHGIQAIPGRFEQRGRNHVERGYREQYRKALGG